MDIHVTNLHLDLVESDLRRIFSPFGEVHTVNLIRDKLNHRSRGRAFIDMPVEMQGKKAILSLNGMKINGRSIVVSEVKYDPNVNTNSFSPEPF